MTSETLLHIEETLDDTQRDSLLRALGNRPDGMRSSHHSGKPHLMFVAYDPEDLCPHDLVEMVTDQGFHARVVDL